jgi:murein DD-endopeptidase MepM/ murein hydrolase activator NlpD
MFKGLAAILAQKLRSLRRGDGTRRGVLLFSAAVLLPFLGTLTAFGIAPDTVTDTLERRTVIEAVTLPELQPPAPSAELFWREVRIERGDTIATLLQRLQIDEAGITQVLSRSKEARGLYRLVPGRTVRAQTTAAGQLVALRYLNAGQLLKIDRDGDQLLIQESAAETEARAYMRSGEIRSSLFAATDAAGISDAIAVQIAEVFSTDIDFHRDLRRGDRFSAVYEVHYHQGEPVRTGRLLSAEFINNGKTYQAVWFENPEGEGGYYTLDGKNIRKAFLRSPLEFSRVSSGFSPSRLHPVLQTWRAHKGVDYAAPTGTRVKATADGIVEFAGRQGGYGNLVVLRHQTRITTWYGHLSGFAQGIKKGRRVSQGEVIGYVGATGIATGPHLHYEFRINDVHQDPLRVAMPPAPPLAPQHRTAFEEIARPQGERLALMRDTPTTIAR